MPLRRVWGVVIPAVLLLWSAPPRYVPMSYSLGKLWPLAFVQS